LGDSPNRHPEAPEIPNPVTSDEIHRVPGYDFMSCQSCHIPYGLVSALLFRDITIPGAVGTTTQYLSADPLNPSDPDKSRWYPTFLWKVDQDGVERLFPVNIWITIYWGDWDQNGTPDDLTDDIIAPINVWRIDQVTGGPLPIVTDDNHDGQLEINRPEEILAYIEVLKGNDSHGRPVALNPVLVKGKSIWYADPEAPLGVSAMAHEGTGIAMDAWYPYLWGMDHNVRPKEEALGYARPGHPYEGCWDCHSQSMTAPVTDRWILIDPYGPDGQPIYQTVRGLAGMNPP
jgi:hypothetical protein